MKSTQALRTELLTLQRRLQVYYSQIEHHKSGMNLLTALFSANVRRQSLQTVVNAHKGIEQTLLEIQEVQEHHFVALFLECLEDEFAQLSDSLFLTEATTHRMSVYVYPQEYSLKQKASLLPVRPADSIK